MYIAKIGIYGIMKKMKGGEGMTTKAWLGKNTVSLQGKTVAISGSTGGLGKALCAHMAALDVARLILLDRNAGKAEALKNALTQRYPDLCVEFVLTDLADMYSVENAAKALETQPIDALILNAGAYAVPRFITSSGYDNVFQINFAAPYYLVRRLAPHLATRGGRVVVVGSIAHNYSKTDPCDVDFRTRKKASLVYGNAKRYLMFAAPEAAERAGLELAVTHPGIAVTGITAHYPKWLYALIKYPMKVIFMKPKRASLSILRGLFETPPKGCWIGPRVFDVWGLPRTSYLHTCDAREKAFIVAEAERVYQNLCEQEGGV